MNKKKKKPVVGLEQLKEERRKTIEKWSKLGLLEGLEGNPNPNIGQLFESQLSQIINESETGNTSQFDKIEFPIVRRPIAPLK